jgi:hypothetical protein
MSTNETLREFFGRRERELSNRAIAVQRELEMIALELAEIRKARAALPATEDEMSRFISEDVGLGEILADIKTSPHIPDPEDAMTASPYDNMTIKQLVVQALRDNRGFRREGASTEQLREFIGHAYGRHIDRSSLTPQLSRLREDKLLVLIDGRWHRPLYRPSVRESVEEAVAELKGKK